MSNVLELNIVCFGGRISVCFWKAKIMKNSYTKNDLHLTSVTCYNSYFNNPLFNLYAHLNSSYILQQIK